MNLNPTSLLQQKISDILFKEWDPIGIQDIPEAYDEYYPYVFEIYQMIILEKTENEIFDFLWYLETEHMGLTGDSIRTESIAKSFHQLID